MKHFLLEKISSPKPLLLLQSNMKAGSNGKKGTFQDRCCQVFKRQINDSCKKSFTLIVFDWRYQYSFYYSLLCLWSEQTARLTAEFYYFLYVSWFYLFIFIVVVSSVNSVLSTKKLFNILFLKKFINIISLKITVNPL